MRINGNYKIRQLNYSVPGFLSNRPKLAVPSFPLEKMGEIN